MKLTKLTIRYSTKWKEPQFGKRTKADVGVKGANVYRENREDIRQVENLLNKENVKITVDDDTIPLKENNPKQEYMSDLRLDLCSQHLKRSIELIVSEVFNKKNI
ncbi:CGH_1_collapsed_G0015500.mRNA.1.CDS.1 [Saccharomyces cerevisiae]|nr:CGH_1_collapsed_G0015500.mRNA.1.CDS.1 [Saccharomyces cerevisiae]